MITPNYISNGRTQSGTAAHTYTCFSLSTLLRRQTGKIYSTSYSLLEFGGYADGRSCSYRQDVTPGCRWSQPTSYLTMSSGAGDGLLAYRHDDPKYQIRSKLIKLEEQYD